MGLFGKDEKDKPEQKTNGGAATPDAQAPDRMKEIRNLSGFNSLDDVANTAEDLIRDSAKKRESGKRISPKMKEEMEAAAKEAKRKLALETLGRFFCRELSVLPYATWSRIYSDPALMLSPEEANKVTEATFLVVQGFDIDFSSPYVGLLGLALMHGTFITTRVKHQYETGVFEDNPEEKKKAEKVQ